MPCRLSVCCQVSWGQRICLYPVPNMLWYWYNIQCIEKKQLCKIPSLPVRWQKKILFADEIVSCRAKISIRAINFRPWILIRWPFIVLLFCILILHTHHSLPYKSRYVPDVCIPLNDFVGQDPALHSCGIL